MWPDAGLHALRLLKPPTNVRGRRARLHCAAGAVLALLWQSSSCCSPDAEAGTKAGPPPAHRRRRLQAADHPRERGTLPTGDGQGGVRLQEVGDFDQPLYVAQPPGDDRDLFVVEKTGRIQVVRDGQRAVRSRSWTSATRSRRGASRACCRSPSRPTTGGRGSCTSTTPTPRATRGWSSTAAPHRIRWSPTRRALARSWAWTSRTRTTTAASAVRPGEAPKGQPRPAVHRARRRRLGGRPGAQRPGPLDPAGQDPAHRPARIGRAPLLGSRTPTRSWAVRAPGRRSTPTASAIRGASPSTAVTGALAIGDVGQNEIEEVDWSRGARAAGRTSAGRPTRASTRFNEDQQATNATPPVLVYGARRRVLDHRRLRGPRRAPANAVRPLPVRRLLRRPAAQLPRHARTPRRRRPRPRPPGPVAELVRRGQRRPHLRDLARGTRLPADRRRPHEVSSSSRPSRPMQQSTRRDDATAGRILLGAVAALAAVVAARRGAPAAAAAAPPSSLERIGTFEAPM